MNIYYSSYDVCVIGALFGTNYTNTTWNLV